MTDKPLRALGVGHAVVQLGGELVEVDAVALEHHQQVVHHVGSLVTQMIHRFVVLPVGSSTASDFSSTSLPRPHSNARAAASDEHDQDSTSFAASATSPASSMTFFSTVSGESVSRRWV